MERPLSVIKVRKKIHLSVLHRGRERKMRRSRRKAAHVPLQDIHIRAGPAFSKITMPDSAPGPRVQSGFHRHSGRARRLVRLDKTIRYDAGVPDSSHSTGLPNTVCFT